MVFQKVRTMKVCPLVSGTPYLVAKRLTVSQTGNPVEAIRQAGSREAFRAVDLEANLAVARAGVSAGARRLGLVSAMSAIARSLLFYNRVKGTLEDALERLPLETLSIARPSFLLGERKIIG